MTSTATAHLTTVIDRWDDLTDMLTTHHGATWPEPMGITQLLHGNRDTEQEQHDLNERVLDRIAERADSRYTLGASPAPLRLTIVDTIRQADTDLVYLCDTLAQEVQRQPMKPAPTSWLPADQDARNRLAAEDAADVRRWRYRGHRSAPYAAAWLLARIEAAPGPFLRLTTVQLGRIEGVAKHVAGRIEAALDLVQSVQPVGRPCPLCAGPLVVASGDGEQPVVTCFGCRQTWTLPLLDVA